MLTAGEHFVPTSDSFDTITASAGHHQGQHSSTSSSSITNSTKYYSQEQNNDDEKEEDFRRSKVYNSIKEASKRRQQKEKEQIETSEKRPKVEPVKTSQNNYPQQQNYQRPSPRKEQILKERPYNFQFVNPPIIQSFNQYSIMPELEDGIVDNSASTLNSKESDILRNWDPTDLVNTLYSVDYAPRIEQKRSKFRNMEGHLEIPNDEITVPEVDPEWKKVYFRTKDSRLQWFATKYADEHPIGDILLSDADIIPNREDFTITIIPKKEVVVPKIVVKVPSNLFEKWRQAFLSHRESTQLDAYVQPILPTIPHLSENIIIIELGSCSIRAGILTHRPSLPQSFFPAIGCVTDSGEIYVGNDALKPEIRHNGTLQQPIDSVDLSVERYQLNKPVLNACLKKIITDLEIVPSKFTVLLSISQNIPSLFISELLKILLNENNFKAASIARQPSLILYSYDVTTGVVVDIGERLNIVPVIDEYIVENAIVSIPFGARQIRESLRENLKQRNNGLYAYQSPIEHTLLRYAVEQACYVSPDFDEEDSKNEGNKEVDMSGFKLAPNMESKFTVDQSRFHAPEGLFKPKKWNIEVKGLHQLIHNAIQLSPIDSRRTLYRNIYLCGGTSLLHGMAERIENELSKLVPGNIHVHVHMSPWRYHAAYLGAQVIASGKLFNKCCATKENLTDYLKQLESSSYSNGN
uniref:Actin n=1 Tax=Panagrolaimus sp. PS1159 TaxID=55785 RepID=A0AC35FHK4_9BILA